MPHPPSPKFYLGAITILQQAEAALRLAGEPAAAYLYEHAFNSKDIDPEQPVINSYTLPNGEQIIIITDRSRSQTVVLSPRDLPDDAQSPQARQC